MWPDIDTFEGRRLTVLQNVFYVGLFDLFMVTFKLGFLYYLFGVRLCFFFLIKSCSVRTITYSLSSRSLPGWMMNG